MLQGLATDETPVAKFTAAYTGVNSHEGEAIDDEVFSGLAHTLELCEGAPVIYLLGLRPRKASDASRPTRLPCVRPPGGAPHSKAKYLHKVELLEAHSLTVSTSEIYAPYCFDSLHWPSSPASKTCCNVHKLCFGYHRPGTPHVCTFANITMSDHLALECFAQCSQLKGCL